MHTIRISMALTLLMGHHKYQQRAKLSKTNKIPISEPIQAPEICAAMYSKPRRMGILPSFFIINPRVTAGFICPPVNCPASTMDMKRHSEMKILEKTPAIDDSIIEEFKHTSTPYANIAVPMNSKKMMLKTTMCFTKKSLSR